MRTFLLLLSVLTLALTLTLAHAAPPATKPTTGPSTKGVTSKPVTVKEMLESLPAECRPEKGRPWTTALQERAEKWMNETYVGRRIEFEKLRVSGVESGWLVIASAKPERWMDRPVAISVVVTADKQSSDTARLVSGDQISASLAISKVLDERKAIYFSVDRENGYSLSLSGAQARVTFHR